MKILLIDDSYEFTEPVKELIEREGHTVDVITNSDEAFQKLGQVHQYDILLLDLMFIVGEKFTLGAYPEVGVLFYKQIRKGNLKLPIIIISALSKNNFQSYFEGDKNLFYINKPLSSNMEELKNCINTIEKK
ncbi:MAG: response regulator [Bacteroidales bacterium]|jgi:CheY-like chemotaxis protein|nr:response regulator [Bacteroidales bacterium]